MEKPKKNKILVLEDDETLSQALKEGLVRSGFEVFLTLDPGQAMRIMNEEQIDILICDCLLPHMTGVDLILKVREEFPQLRFKVVLMSGIYTDSQFIQDASRKTQALVFLKKPFPISEVIQIVNKNQIAVGTDIGARKILYQIFENKKVTARHKKKAIDSLEEVMGFDLPFIYSLLADSKSSGFLNIYNSDGSISSVTFCNGNIIGVDSKDLNSTIGEVLLQSGFCTVEDVLTALENKENRRTGVFLIQSNRISPHALDLALMEQMNMRLVQTIIEDKIRVYFSVAEIEMPPVSIDSEAFLVFLHDWIASKISVEWLKSLYVLWAGKPIIKTSIFYDEHPAMQMSLVQNLDRISERLEKNLTLNDLLEIEGYSEITVYKAIHFMLTKGLIVFTQIEAFANVEQQNAFLKKMWTNLRGKNEFQIITYLDNCGMAHKGLNELTYEFNKLIGSEPSDSFPEAQKLWRDLKSIVQDAVEMAADTTKIDRVREESLRHSAEVKLKAASLMEEIKKLLYLNQCGAASVKLAEVEKLNPEIQQFHIFNSWAKLGMTIDSERKLAMLKDVELELLQIPADEKYDAIYSFVVGLVSKNQGDLIDAKKSFEKSIMMDPSFLPARRELSSLGALNKKNQDVFNRDIKEMVTGFFKKK